jgi:hypothetical protein
MFKVRREQMDAYREAAIRDFEDQVVEHLVRCLPEQAEAMGDRGLRDLVRLGIERAAAFGIVAQRDVCKFIDLMLVFGADFDRRCAWASEILAAPEPADPFARMRLLHARALEEA